MKRAWKVFKAFAAARGYTRKVSGDYAFEKHYNGKPDFMRLISAKSGILIITTVKNGIAKRESVPF